MISLQNHSFPRRSLLAAFASLPFLSACIYDREFILEWDEEVQLQDGRVIVMHSKQTYMRIEQGLTRYGGLIRPLDRTISFDGGPSIGQVTQLFKGFQPIFLDHYEGTWYTVIVGGHYPKSREMPGQNWGAYDGPRAHHVAKFLGGRFVPVALAELPAKFEFPNLMVRVHPKDHEQFAGKRLDLADKVEWKKKYPPSPDDARLDRSPARNRKSANNEGESK